MTWEEYAELSAEQCNSMAATIAEDGTVTCATVGVTESTVTLPDTAMPTTDIAGIGALLVLTAIGAALRRMVQR